MHNESTLVCRANEKVYELLSISGAADGARISPVFVARGSMHALPCRVYELERHDGGSRSVVAVYPDAPASSSFYALGEFDEDGGLLDVREIRVDFKRVKWASRANYRLRPNECARIKGIDERTPDTFETRFETLFVIPAPPHLILKCRVTLPDSSHRGDVSVSAVGNMPVPVASDYIVLSETSAASPVEGGPRPYRLAFSMKIPEGQGDLLFVVSSTKTGEVLHVERQTREFRDAMRAHMDHMLYRHSELDPFYAEWFGHHRVTGFELGLQRLHPVPGGPSFTVIAPVRSVQPDLLSETVGSVARQSYPLWELLVVGVGSDLESLRCELARFVADGGRVHIVSPDELRARRTSVASSSRAGTDYVCLLAPGDSLEPDALYEYAQTIADGDAIDLIYCDEDRLAPDGTPVRPFFKPDFDIDLLRSNNYMSHLLMLKGSLFDLLEPNMESFDGAQLHDMALRAYEKGARIRHIPRVLYHSRIEDPSPTDPVASLRPTQGELQVVRDHLQRMGIHASVTIGDRDTLSVVYDPPESNPLVSIVIPTKNNARILARCLDSILSRSTYQNFELLIIDNGSTEPEVNDVYASIADERVSVVHYDVPFNFSAIINEGARRTHGEYLLLLNNDTEVITENWIELLLGTCARRDVGAVGAKLLYPDNTIQHAGVNITGGPVHLFAHLPNGMRSYHDFADTPRDLSAVTGACMMTKRSAFNEVGGFDEELVVTFNDVDYCLKLGAAGYLVVYDPLVELYHYESISRGADEDRAGKTRSLREKAVLLTRWPEPYVCDPYYSPSPRQGDPECAYYAF